MARWGISLSNGLLRVPQRGRAGHILACLLVAIHGCQSSPARVAGCDPHTAVAPRRLVCLRQVLADSAQEMCYHPLRSGQAFACAAVDHVDTVRRGLVGKRLLM